VRSWVRSGPCNPGWQLRAVLRHRPLATGRQDRCVSCGVAFSSLGFLPFFLLDLFGPVCLSVSLSLGDHSLARAVWGRGPRMPSIRSTMQGRVLVSDTVPDVRCRRNRCCTDEGSDCGCRAQGGREVYKSRQRLYCPTSRVRWQGARCKGKGAKTKDRATQEYHSVIQLKESRLWMEWVAVRESFFPRTFSLFRRQARDVDGQAASEQQ